MSEIYISVLRSDSVKRSVVCVGCGGPRPVKDWAVREPCGRCGATPDREQQEVVERYRDLVNIIEQINTNTDQMEEANYNYQSCWVAAVMGEVCSNRDIRQAIMELFIGIFWKYFVIFTKFFLIFPPQV